MIKVLLAIFVGLLRARPTVEAGDRAAGHRGARDLMDTRIQIVAIVATAGLFVIVFELVRRRRLMERYALLWLFATAILLGARGLARPAREVAARVGIYYAPSALFAIAFGFVLVLLLHFSLVISRLADQNKVLAQRLGLLQQQVDDLRARHRARAGEPHRRDDRARRPALSMADPARRGRHRRLRERRARSARDRCARAARAAAPTATSSWSSTTPRATAAPPSRAPRRPARRVLELAGNGGFAGGLPRRRGGEHGAAAVLPQPGRRARARARSTRCARPPARTRAGARGRRS